MNNSETKRPDSALPFSLPNSRKSRIDANASCTGGSSGGCGACSGSSCACGTGGGECAFLPLPELEQEIR